MGTVSDNELAWYQSIVANPAGKSLLDLRYAFYIGVLSGSLSLGGGLSVPSDVKASAFRTTTSLAGLSDTATHLYVPSTKRSPFQNAQAGLSRARAGAGVFRITCLGDSLTYGSLVTNPHLNGWTQQLAKRLSAFTGLPYTSGLITPDSSDPRQVIVGATISAGCWSSSNTAHTITVTTLEAGDRILIPYWRQGAYTFSYQIDGGSVNNVAVTDSVVDSGWVVVTGLANTVHTVVIKPVTGTITVAGVGVERTGGIAVSRLGTPGQSTPDFVSSPSYTWPSDPWKMMLNAGAVGGPRQDLLLSSFGTNDLFFQNVSPSQNKARNKGLVNVLAAYSTPTDIALGVPIPLGAAPVGTNWLAQDIAAAIYEAGEESGFPVLDLRDKWGAFASADARGLYNADDTHLTQMGYDRLGGDWAAALMAYLN